MAGRTALKTGVELAVTFPAPIGHYGSMTLGQHTISAIQKHAARRQLELMGCTPARSDDPVPAGSQSILLFGPKEPGFWEHFSSTPEYLDDNGDALDRWSTRTVSELAVALGGTALFPFQEPPLPFIGWALRSSNLWTSPIAMLVHGTAGLFVSFRGAIALPFSVGEYRSSDNPCPDCKAPCATACPVNALGTHGYDVSACHAYLDTPDGQQCMQNGCAARLACPVSKTSGRLPEQSAFHMKAFHP